MRSASSFQFPGLRRLAGAVAAVLWALALAACASKPKPTVALVSVTAAADVNPDARGRASPVMLRIYELRSRAAFDSADFFGLYSADKETLAADLGNKDERTVTPGATFEITKTPAPDIRYLGLVAAFRDIERANWRAAVALPPNQTTPVRVRLERNGLAVTTP